MDVTEAAVLLRDVCPIRTQETDILSSTMALCHWILSRKATEEVGGACSTSVPVGRRYVSEHRVVRGVRGRHIVSSGAPVEVLRRPRLNKQSVHREGSFRAEVTSLFLGLTTSVLLPGNALR